MEEIKYVGSSKKEIWDAYQNALKANGDKAKTIAEIESAEKKKGAVIRAESSLSLLKDTFNDINSVISKAEDNLNTLNIAIEAKTERLQELTEMENIVIDLDALRAVKEKEVQDVAGKASNIYKEKTTALKKLEIDYTERNEALERAYENRAKELERDQATAQNDFNYNFGKMKKEKEQELNDYIAEEKRNFDKDLRDKKDELARTILKANEDQLALDKEREDVEILKENFSKSKTEISQLKAIVTAKDQKIKDLEVEFDNARSLSQSKIENLENSINNKNDEIDYLKEKLKAAEETITKMSLAAVESKANEGFMAKIAGMLDKK